jgi:hypothetical protein
MSQQIVDGSEDEIMKDGTMYFEGGGSRGKLYSCIF